MTYEIRIERSAARTLRRCDSAARRKLDQAIKALATDPRPAGTKALTGPYAGHYRLRVSAPGGEYRIIWTIDDKALVVRVVEAGPREGSY